MVETFLIVVFGPAPLLAVIAITAAFARPPAVAARDKSQVPVHALARAAQAAADRCYRVVSSHGRSR